MCPNPPVSDVEAWLVEENVDEEKRRAKNARLAPFFPMSVIHQTHQMRRATISLCLDSVSSGPTRDRPVF
jgi:hypothetical protein